ncbi:MAG: zinc-binding dehydrogenase [Proteobacteria bacterium]|nr:zinc-binding dehydrogenase [Pseudomonadota bacterium]
MEISKLKEFGQNLKKNRMKALFFRQHGSIGNLEYGDFKEPKLAENSAIIKVKAAALNRLDLWVLQGWPGLKLTLPHIGGADISGEIVEVDKNQSIFKPGERVAVAPGFIPANHQDQYTTASEDSVSPEYKIFGEAIDGGFCEYISVPLHTLIKIPEKISHSLSAAVLLVGTTCWRMLVNKAKVKKDESVLIVGAGGGVNSFSVILAKHLGAKVFVLGSSDEKCERSIKLGADVAINFNTNLSWHKEIKRLTAGEGVDVVIDNVGAKTFSHSLATLKRGGRLVTVGNTSGYNVSFDNRLVFAKQLSILGSTMGSFKDTVAACNFSWTHPLINQLVDKEMPLSDGKRAYEILETGSHFGKVLLIP